MRQALCMRLLNAQCWVLLEVTLCGTSRPGCTPGGVTRSHRTVSLPCFPQCVEEILGYLKSCFNREPMMATVCVQQVRTCSPVLFAAAPWRRGGGTCSPFGRCLEGGAGHVFGSPSCHSFAHSTVRPRGVLSCHRPGGVGCPCGGQRVKCCHTLAAGQLSQRPSRC